jgi:hypothetical protein
MGGYIMKYRFEVRENEFHGGAHIGYSNSLKGALRFHDCCTDGDCECGGHQIIPNDDLEKFPENAKYFESHQFQDNEGYNNLMADIAEAQGKL